MKKEMLINVLQPEETRIAILEDGILEELYVERVSNEGFVGNIYKGKIVNIEPSIQAAFVDFGVGRNGFLHISDVDPHYFEPGRGIDALLEGTEAREERSGDRRPRQRSTARPATSGRGGRDSREANDRQKSGSGRRPRGRKREVERDEVPADLDLTDVPLTGSGSLPSLDDFQIDEDSDQMPGVKGPEGDQPQPTVDASPEEIEAPIEERRESTSGPSDEGSSTPEDDAFGLGILEDDGDDEPPVETQQGVERRTSTSDDDDDDFGGGLFDEEAVASTHSASDAADDGAADFESESEAPTDSRVDDSPIATNWGLTDDEENSSEIQEDSDSSDSGEAQSTERPGGTAAAKEESSDDDAPRPRRRRRRGSRRRRDQETRDTPEVFQPDEGGDDFAPNLDDAEFDDGISARGESEREESPGRNRSSRDRRPGRTNGRPRGSARRPRQRPPIQEIFKRGQEVLVQVIKEGIGNKGPTLSTYISIPGRYLVLMPGLNRVGVSRKIMDDDQRRQLRDIVVELKRPKGVGLIVRTAGLERTPKELNRDLTYLSRLWDAVIRRIKNLKAPAVIYQESDMIIRTIRDIFSSEIDTIYIDEASAYERAKEFLQLVMPRYVNRLKHYEAPEPLFHRFGIEDEIANIQERTVPLPRGGSIVVDQTEALVAIDVNSGNFRADDNAEETAYQINLAAAQEIGRQLRLRDLGGVIVNDFIDMREERHRRAVEQALYDAVKRDRARTKVLRMSAFGLIEMTRQRIRPSLKRSLYRECPMCHGTAQIKTVESMAIDCMRLLTYIGQHGKVRSVQLTVEPEVASYLQNHKRKELVHVEASARVTLSIIGKEMKSPEDIHVLCHDADGKEVPVDVHQAVSQRR